VLGALVAPVTFSDVVFVVASTKVVAFGVVVISIVIIV
jgi:hypothetical protein